jgi:hypothetical protein
VSTRPTTKEVSWAADVRDKGNAAPADFVKAARILAHIPSFPYRPARFGGPADQGAAFLEAVLSERDLPAKALEIVGRLALEILGSSWFISDVVGCVAAHPNSPPDTLRQIDARHAFPDCLARNPATPSDVLEHLADYPDRKVKHWVLLNPSTPAGLADRLSKEPDAWVQAAGVLRHNGDLS